MVKDNELIRNAKYDLTLQQQKFLLYCISLIDQSDPPDKRFEVSIKDACSMFGLEQVGANYKRLRDSIEAVASARVWVRETTKWVLLTWIEHIMIHINTQIISFQFDPGMRPYLFELKRNFTVYELRDVVKMTSKYSIRLYELLKSYLYLGECDIDITSLKERLMCEKQYTEYKNFRRKVLDVAVDDINYCTTLSVSYKPIRFMRKIIKLHFSIKDVGYRNPVEELIYDHKDDNAT